MEVEEEASSGHFGQRIIKTGIHEHSYAALNQTQRDPSEGDGGYNELEFMSASKVHKARNELIDLDQPRW